MIGDLTSRWPDERELEELNRLIKDTKKIREKAEDQLLEYRINNAKKLQSILLNLATEKMKKERDLQREATIEYKQAQINSLGEIHKLKKDLRNKDALEQLKVDTEVEKKIIQLKDQLTKEAKKKNGGKLSKEDKARIKEEVKEREKLIEEAEKTRQKAAGHKRLVDAGAALTKEAGLDGKFGALFSTGMLKANGWTDKQAKEFQMQAAFDALADIAKQLKSDITNIAEAQTKVDTRLQGSKNEKSIFGSYWQRMSTHIVEGIGLSPYVKQSAVVENLKTMVGQGIAFNVEQRAFLATIKDSIADTFDANDTTLKKLVRIQQEDSTAARLGMESALTSFLNNMYETTEYMTEAANQIRSQLYEASALMGTAQATGFEFQVQKWLGSLYSVGFSNTSNISSALGQLASGQISGISNGGTGNLMVMAANRANLSIADVLSKGLDESDTNRLMQAMVDYLAEIYSETKGSNVLAQQFAGVYGLTASDLKAAANLSSSTKTVASNNLDYNGMMKQLSRMTNTIWLRTSVGGMMNNLLANLKYTTAESMANNPILYATYYMADMLQDTVGGINIPSFTVAGTGVDINATVADLMRVGTLGAGLLSGIGKVVTGLGKGLVTSGGIDLLSRFGINSNINSVSRGDGSGYAATASLNSISSSGYVGNSAGGDVQSKTMTDATDSANTQLAEAVDDSEETTLADVNTSVLDIYKLLVDITEGTKQFHVDIDDTMSWTDSTGNAMLARF